MKQKPKPLRCQTTINPTKNSHLHKYHQPCYTHPIPLKNYYMLPQAPQSTPSEVVQLQPEQLTIANSYLQCGSVEKTAAELDLPTDIVAQTLQLAHVRAYTTQLFMETGFANRHVIRRAMDAVIRQKLQELEDSQTGSNKDIADLLQLSHKMSMDLLDRELQLAKLQQQVSDAQIRNQTNIQINGTDTQYAKLIQQLLDSDARNK